VNPILLKPIERVLVGILGLIIWAVIAFSFGALVMLLTLHQLKGGLILQNVPAFILYHSADKHVMKPFLIGALVGTGLCAWGAYELVRDQRALYGDAKFAREAHAKKALLRAEQGIFMGMFNGKPLIYGGAGHVLTEAPTRAGKGVGIVIPNLLSWPHSAVALDVKQENFDITSGWRGGDLGQRVFLFDPLSIVLRTHFYNPLSYINRADPIEVIDELQRVAVTLFPQSGDNPFWVDAARMGFVGVGAYLAASDLPFTIGAIFKVLTDDPLKKLPKLVNTRQHSDNPLSSGCVMLINDFVQKSGDVFTSVKSTITSRIGLWVNPRVDFVTSRSDFELHELRHQAITIYLGANPGDLERLAPLYNLFMQQLIDRNTRLLPGQPGAGEVPVLVILDEFKRLGKAGVIQNAFSYVAGYGIKLLPIIQSRFQLNEVYGFDGAKEIVTNCDCEILYALKDADDARKVSERIGDMTVKSKSISQPNSWFSSNSSGGSQSEADHKRALLLTQEVTNMDQRLGLIFKAGTPPVLHQKARYYEMPVFKARLRPALTVATHELPVGYSESRSIVGDEPTAAIIDMEVLTERKPLPRTAVPKNYFALVEAGGNKIKAEIEATGFVEETTLNEAARALLEGAMV